MSKQRKLHHKVVCRQHTYKFARRLAAKDFGFKHYPCWRKISAVPKSLIQQEYIIFGPEDFDAKPRR